MPVPPATRAEESLRRVGVQHRLIGQIGTVQLLLERQHVLVVIATTMFSAYSGITCRPSVSRGSRTNARSASPLIEHPRRSSTLHAHD